MPELPEVERVRRTIEPLVLGRRIEVAELLRRDFCRTSRGRQDPGHDLLQGAAIKAVIRRGKQFALIAEDGRALCFHLGMSGQVIRVEDGSPTHVHARWKISGRSGWLVFRDPRRFGGLWAFESLDLMESTRWGALGPDALSIRATQLGAALAAGKRAVKAALLDQGTIAGVGNIYADEALFAAGIHPITPCRRLTSARIARLATEIRAVLRKAVRAGGSSLRDFVDAEGAPGGYQGSHLVYGRAGLPCTRCGVLLLSMRVSGRATVFCPRCQRTGCE